MQENFLSTFLSQVYAKVLKPRSANPDIQRQEFILNVLLAGLLFVCTLALIVNLTIFLFHQNQNGNQSLFITIAFLIAVGVSRWAVAKGLVRLIAYILVLLLFIASTELLFNWGFTLPQMLLDYTVVIVIAGILVNARFGLFMAVVSVFVLLSGAYFQLNEYFKPDSNWINQAPHLFDAVGYGLIFALIGLVSWLSNREIDASLTRARTSEAALLRERDLLEVKVVERTKELERLQLVRVMELERFAAFGRVSAALVHEVSNPLMAATLSLKMLESVEPTKLNRVSKNLLQIERQIQAARMQLRGGSILSYFSVAQELQRVAELMRPVAQRQRVQLQFPRGLRVKLRGDPVKFSQIVSNLLINAIESYPPGTADPTRRVHLSVRQQKQYLRLVVHDWGGGISPENIDRIFEPFYSSKPSPETHMGMGIGLGMVKQFVEADYHGNIKVTSSQRSGTKFTVWLWLDARVGDG